MTVENIIMSVYHDAHWREPGNYELYLDKNLYRCVTYRRYAVGIEIISIVTHTQDGTLIKDYDNNVMQDMTDRLNEML